MNWLRRIIGAHKETAQQETLAPLTAPMLSHEEVASRQAQRAERIAAARQAAFDGAGQLPFREILSGLPSDGVVYAGLDHADRLVLATSPSDPEQSYAGRDERPGWATFPHSVADESYPVRIELFDPQGRSAAVATSLSVAFPHMDTTPDGGFLVVGTRARYTSSGPESNAIVLDTKGHVVRSFCVGDGVEHVQVTPSGKIWVGYFDEGVYGNYGWGSPDGPEPLGRAGLVRWSLDGEHEYGFSTAEGPYWIDDCYALSVIGEDAWACYYSDFPVVRVRPNGSVTTWACGVAGARGLAVLGAERVGHVGGYDGLHDRLVVSELGDGRCAGTRTLQLVTPEGAELPADARVFARGSAIHALMNGRWLRTDLRDLSG